MFTARSQDGVASTGVRSHLCGAARLEQVVVNFLTNAAKYIEHGGHIWPTVEREGNHCVLRVRDTGIGIAPELLPRVFDLFTQIPSIDDDGLVLSESAAILVYLAKKSGRLIPGDHAGEAQVVRWCFAAMNSVEPPLLSLLVLDWTADGSWGKHREFLVAGRIGC